MYFERVKLQALLIGKKRLTTIRDTIYKINTALEVIYQRQHFGHLKTRRVRRSAFLWDAGAGLQVPWVAPGHCFFSEKEIDALYHLFLFVSSEQ